MEKMQGLVNYPRHVPEVCMPIRQNEMRSHSNDFCARHADTPIVWAGENEWGKGIVWNVARDDPQLKGY
jgi:hypothetical protein